MTEAKHTFSPIKKVKAALTKTPKSPTSPAAERDNSEHQRVIEIESRMEEIYFHDPQSRECLSDNPGDHFHHEAERRKCTTDNWKAEIERRTVAKSAMVDYAYGEKHPYREQAYGHGDGQK